jgi:hypothetical protein
MVKVMSLFKGVLSLNPISVLDPGHIRGVLNADKVKKALNKLGVKDEQKESFVLGIIGKDRFPPQLASDDELGNKVLEKLKGSAPVNEKEAKQALQLLQSGESFKDVAFTVSTLLAFIVNPKRFAHPRPDLDTWLKGFPPAIGGDIRALIGNVITQIKDGNRPGDPQILNETLRQIYQNREIGNAIDTANVLFHPDNQSLRLALVIYARLNGVDLEDRDIDEVRETVLNRSSPDLGRLLAYAFDNKTRLLGR